MAFLHANTDKAWDKLRRILTLCRIVVSETAAFRNRLKHLDYRVREFFDYLGNNNGTLLDYGRRYRAGKPTSTAMAESAVNQVVNARMCKRQQCAGRHGERTCWCRCAVQCSTATSPPRQRAAPVVTATSSGRDSCRAHGSPDRVNPTVLSTPENR